MSTIGAYVVVCRLRPTRLAPSSRQNAGCLTAAMQLGIRGRQQQVVPLLPLLLFPLMVKQTLLLLLPLTTVTAPLMAMKLQLLLLAVKLLRYRDQAGAVLASLGRMTITLVALLLLGP